ncbi:DUF1476 domain-containing protein [Temperatibacter marinus]|uniref:DUF1476 domain-containing protein n=1 Tax=Temperatibacter marinus TaxID=1456591 RepID=A0AA52EGQ6_9PROT|nr:DUF1476 domain-containing protein [Temperatibacter marinus]WND02217.1 DUF1476 domain-containing protein [Temperatibacter marinus]
MTTFDAREKAFEDKFAHDQEMLFKAEARRNKLAGEWAGRKLGKSGDDLETYIKSVIIADLEEAGHDDVKRKIHADFVTNSLDISEHRIDKKLTDLLTEAKHQIMNGL